MSRLTNFAENKLIDFARGQALGLPASWYIALGTAADDGAFTEIAGTWYNRLEVLRDLLSWAGTQGEGTTLASTGTSHTTSNNNLLDFGTADAAHTVTHVALFSGVSGGDRWLYAELPSPIEINPGSPVEIEAGTIVITITGSATDYLANKLIDLMFRGQAFTWPANTYHALYTSSPNNAGGGVEVSGGGYARAVYAASLANWSPTQTVDGAEVSSGETGLSYNNNQITYPTPTANWGTISHAGERDASSGGNLLWYAPLTSPVVVNNGASAPYLPPGAVSRRFA